MTDIQKKLKYLLQLKLAIQTKDQERTENRMVWQEAGHKVRTLSLEINTMTKKLIDEI